MISSSHKRKKKIKKILNIFLFAILLLIILSIVAILVIQNNRSFSFSQKKDGYRQLQYIIDSMTFPGSTAYSRIHDEKCTETPSIFSSSYYCSYTAKKYFKNNKELQEDIKDSKKILTDQGWEERSDHFINKHQNLTLRFTYYPKKDSLASMADVLQIGSSIPLKQGEYVYGIEIYSPYWGCSYSSIFQLPCPEPPKSEMKTHS